MLKMDRLPLICSEHATLGAIPMSSLWGRIKDWFIIREPAVTIVVVAGVALLIGGPIMLLASSRRKPVPTEGEVISLWVGSYKTGGGIVARLGDGRFARVSLVGSLTCKPGSVILLWDTPDALGHTFSARSSRCLASKRG